MAVRALRMGSPSGDLDVLNVLASQLAAGVIPYHDGTDWQRLANAAGDANKVLGSNGAAAPSWKTVAATLEAVGSTRGQVLRRNATAWEALSVGATKRVLSSDGTDVLYQTIATILEDLLTTRGDVVRRGASAVERLAKGATNTILSADANDTLFQTLSTLMDNVLGSTRGALAMRGSGGWSKVDPGTSGHVLTSNGSGADPTYQAAPGGNDPRIQIKRKSADQGKTSDTSLAADTHLTGFTVTALKSYAFELLLIAQSGSATPDLKFDLDCGVGFTEDREMIWNQDQGATTGAFQYVSGVASDIVIALTAAVVRYIFVTGQFKINASGTSLSFRWAQNTSNGTSTNLLAGSWMRITQID